MHQLEEGFHVSGQITAGDVPELAASGIRTIINNRPDGEVPGQPESGSIRDAALAAGLDWIDLPITQLTSGAVDDTSRALNEAKAPILAYCASGTRSTYLWALARSAQGKSADGLIERASAAGYDLAPIRRFMR